MKINKEGNKTTESISHKIKFIDSMRFLATSVSNLVDNLTGGIHQLKCKNCNCFLEYKNIKDSLIEYNCSSSSKYFSIVLDEELQKKLKKTFLFSKQGRNRFI